MMHLWKSSTIVHNTCFFYKTLIPFVTQFVYFEFI